MWGSQDPQATSMSFAQSTVQTNKRNGAKIDYFSIEWSNRAVLEDMGEPVEAAPVPGETSWIQENQSEDV